MEEQREGRTGFLGTYFDRDVTLRIARFAGILAWGMLGLYAYMAFISAGQFWFLAASSEVSYANANIFDRLNIPSFPLSQVATGLMYFTLLKTAQQVLLILLDVEDNARRASRK